MKKEYKKRLDDILRECSGRWVIRDGSPNKCVLMKQNYKHELIADIMPRVYDLCEGLPYFQFSKNPYKKTRFINIRGIFVYPPTERTKEPLFDLRRDADFKSIFSLGIGELEYIKTAMDKHYYSKNDTFYKQSWLEDWQLGELNSFK
jgi:hypothetical protein